MRRLAALATLSALSLLALAAGLWVVLPDPSEVKARNPRTTAVIEQRRAEARAHSLTLRVRQSWVGLDRVAPALVQAVLVSEDARFYGHGAFDWAEVEAAADDSLRSGRTLRGASTLTQQLAKNLWLGTERSAWRKAKEAVLAVKLERAVPKRRILALYLNVAEWGEGVFGIEAAARVRFGVSAAALTPAQASLLAAMLPAPRRADLDHPSRWLARRARRILDRMLAAGRLDEAAHAAAARELAWYLDRSTGDEEPPEDAG